MVLCTPGRCYARAQSVTALAATSNAQETEHCVEAVGLLQDVEHRARLYNNLLSHSRNSARLTAALLHDGFMGRLLADVAQLLQGGRLPETLVSRMP